MPIPRALPAIIAALGLAWAAAAHATPAISPPEPLPPGPCADPWVSAAVEAVMNRPAVGAGRDVHECDVRRYGGGGWKSYEDLVSRVTAAYARCRDKWITAAVWQVRGRRPRGEGDRGECDYRRYGGGRWSSYADLLAKVRAALRPPRASSGGKGTAGASGTRAR